MPSPPSVTSSVANTNASSTTLTLVVPTINSGDIVIVDSGVTNPMTSVTSPNLGTFTQHTQFNSRAYRHSKVAGSALTNETITITQSVSAAFISGQAASISGVNTSSPFDSAGPVTGTVTLGSSNVQITPTNNNTLIYAFFDMGGTASPTAGTSSAFVGISASGSFSITEYVVLATAGTINCTLTTGNGDVVDFIVDALVPGSPTVPPNPGASIRYLGWYASALLWVTSSLLQFRSLLQQMHSSRSLLRERRRQRKLFQIPL